MLAGFRLSIAALLLDISLAASPALAAHHGWKTAAGVGEAGLVTLALGKSAIDQDWQGEGQAAMSLGVTLGATEALKYAIHEERPDRSDDKSFPSGHTSISFAAAGYLQKRYGWQWGLPATIAASLVGVSRVESKSHYWYDVVAGAALGEASAYFLTTPRNGDIRFVPWADRHGAGFTYARRF